MSEESPTPPFIEDLHAPELFADAASGFFLINGNLRITFESGRASHTANPGPASRVVVGRLVMPAHMAEGMAREVLAFLALQRGSSDEGD